MKKLLTENPKLSVVIVSFNTKDILADCLDSLYKQRKELPFEVIVSDNASSDGTQKMVKTIYPWVKLIENGENLGFAKGNNAARKVCKAKIILFLNSDTIVPRDTLIKAYEQIIKDKKIGALTCKTILPSGVLDPDARRSFPTPWVAFSHFSGLDRLFPTSALFSRYWYGYVSSEVEQEVEVIQGAFFMTPKQVLDEIDWFDESYFLDGEDIDLCWKIKKVGYKIKYFPDFTILHLKKASKKKAGNKSNVVSGVKSMELFYRKQMWQQYPMIVNYLVIIGIAMLKLIRSIK